MRLTVSRALLPVLVLLAHRVRAAALCETAVQRRARGLVRLPAALTVLLRVIELASGCLLRLAIGRGGREGLFDAVLHVRCLSESLEDDGKGLERKKVRERGAEGSRKTYA